MRRLGTLYRGAAADLALARRRYAADPVVGRLEALVGRARHLVYDAESRRGSVPGFFARDYWRLVRERPVLLALAWALLLGPAVLAGGWALGDPAAASGLVPGAYQSVTQPRQAGQDLGLTADEETVLSSQIFVNNIRVSFVGFAAGIAAGLGTAFVLVTNGVLLGTVFGLAIGAGNGVPLVELVFAHGVLELSCIAVTAAAGLRLGWALVDPGQARRSDAIVAQARPAVLIVLGTAPWLVLAGLVEGFITPAGLGLGPVLVIGGALGIVYWALVLWRGATPETLRD
ncbi:MAG: stage II sporulation protein M [Actinobacteria bacterium]|nr:stage II sporulation protein M [Actinomycetota bacterium]